MAANRSGRVIVVGSVNQDVTITVDRFPRPGETLHGRSLSYGLGGKGANQAAAAAHGGAPALMVGAVGGDDAGASLRRRLAEHGVDTSRLDCLDEAATGSAFITVDAAGENTIIIAPGANGRVTARALDAVEGLGADDVVVLQGEIPPEANAGAVRRAVRCGARVVLNPAPAYEVADQVLAGVDVLVVNETEAGLVLSRPAPDGVDEALRAARDLRKRGPAAVVVTLGAAGGVWADGRDEAHVPAVVRGPVVDTTGAGDAAVGVLAAALALGLSLPEAVAEGMRAGGAAVLAPGAAESYAGLEPVALPG